MRKSLVLATLGALMLVAGWYLLPAAAEAG
jgi:hypothetical protein